MYDFLKINQGENQVKNKLKKKSNQTMRQIRYLTYLGFLWLFISCGGPIQLVSEEGPVYEDHLDSTIGKDRAKKIRAPKYNRPTAPFLTRSVSDVITTDTSAVTPPPPSPVLVQQADSPQYVQQLKQTTSARSGGVKIRQPTMTVTMTVTGKPPSSTGKVDIVFVVDASTSMFPFLKTNKIEQAFAHFIPTLKPLDWQMMFINADYGDKGRALRLERDGTLLRSKILKKGPMADLVFIDTLRKSEPLEHMNSRGSEEKSECHLGPGCHGLFVFNEQPLKSLKASFTNNRSFFRPGADVIAIIYSDTDEGESYRDPSKKTRAEEVLRAFNEQWGHDNKRLMAYGIIMIPGEDQACVQKYSGGFFGSEGVFGTELARMAEITGGENYSICDTNYVPLAQKMVSHFQKQ